MFSLIAVTLSALSLVSGAPIRKAPQPRPKGPPGFFSSSCSAAVADATINFPAGQTNLTYPAGQKVESIFVGRGTQNYSCASTGTWSQVGAMATLTDVTCLYPILPSSTFFSIPKTVLALPSPPSFTNSSSNPIAKQIAQFGAQQGQHYFITEPTGTTPSGNQPKFDFTAGGDPADTANYVTGTKIASLSDPTNAATNVAWLQLNAIPNQGTFASTVFRVDTAGGQPSATCTAGATSNVDYAALYFFYK